MALAALTLAGCLFDGGGSRRISGDYALHQWEDGATYYLVDRTADVNGGGVIEGTVQAIGWNAEYILADRKALAGADPDGWMLVDVRRKTVRGPLSPNEVASLRQTLAVGPIGPADAWKLLD